MKRILIPLLIAVLALSGCVNGKFLGFLATGDYVDAKTKAVTDQQAAEIAKLKAQLADYEAIKTQAAAAMEQMNQTQKTVQDLQALARKAEARIGSMPREIIQQIADILQASQR